MMDRFNNHRFGGCSFNEGLGPMADYRMIERFTRIAGEPDIIYRYRLASSCMVNLEQPAVDHSWAEWHVQNPYFQQMSITAGRLGRSVAKRIKRLRRLIVR